jgi:hypothetical protein
MPFLALCASAEAGEVDLVFYRGPTLPQDILTNRAASSGRRRPASIPLGAWPRRMRADLAAGYCGEATVEDFLRRVGKEYPVPRVAEGRRRLWLIDDLDMAIAPCTAQGDLAEDL